MYEIIKLKHQDIFGAFLCLNKVRCLVHILYNVDIKTKMVYNLIKVTL